MSTYWVCCAYPARLTRKRKIDKKYLINTFNS
jgi:hypothetical protein